jgi:hypothetical protein
MLDGSSTIRAFQKEVCLFFSLHGEESIIVIALRHSEKDVEMSYFAS